MDPEDGRKGSEDEYEECTSEVQPLNGAIDNKLSVQCSWNDPNLLRTVFTEENDYYPFKSKQEALLYILVNSPRPVVSLVAAVEGQ